MMNRSLHSFGIRLLGLITVAILLANCASQPTQRAEVKKNKRGEAQIVRARKLYSWPGDPGGGKLSVRIDLADQRADFLRGGKRIGWTLVATGLPQYPTPTGNFRITEKLEMKRSGTYGVIFDENGEITDNDAKRGREKIPKGGRFEGADMPYWQRLTATGIGMHAGFLPNPGQPASHGCIRMPKDFAPIAFRITSIGTPVTIVRSQSDDPPIEYEEKLVSPSSAQAEEEIAEESKPEVKKEEKVEEMAGDKKRRVESSRFGFGADGGEVSRPRREMPMPTSQSTSRSSMPILVDPAQFIRSR